MRGMLNTHWVWKNSAPASIFLRRQSVAGSVIGGIQETQEMLDFCAQHGIVSDIELIKIRLNIKMQHVPYSGAGPAACSIALARPMPRSRPAARDASRRAAKPA